MGAARFVHFSSETVPGFVFALRPFSPEYLPIDEEHPVRPQDAYATAKWFGELLCERAVERSDIRCTSIRPSWVQDEGSYERNLGPIVRDPSVLIGNYCSYIDVHDLCDAVVLAIETDLPGHEVFYIASPDTIGGHPLAETVMTHYGAEGIELRPTAREDASAVSSEKARAAPRVDADTLLARLPGRAGTVAPVRRRQLGRLGPELSLVGFGAWAIGGPWRFGWGRGRRRRVGRRDPALDRARRQLGRHRGGLRARSLRGGRRAVRSARSGSVRTCSSSRSAVGAGKVGRRARSGTISAPSRSARSASAACAGSGSSASTSTRCTGPTGRRGPCSRSRGGRWRRSSRRGRRAGSASRTSTSSSSSAARRRHVDSVQPPLSLLVRGALSTVVPWAARARRRRARLLAARLGAPHGRRSTAERIARFDEDDWRRDAPAFREPLLVAEPRARRASCGDRGRARDDVPRRSRSPGCWRSPASRRVSSGLACRVTSTVGRSRPISRRARTPSAGSARRSPRPGLGPTCRRRRRRTSGLSRTDPKRRSTEHETRPVVDGEHQQGDPPRRRRVGSRRRRRGRQPRRGEGAGVRRRARHRAAPTPRTRSCSPTTRSTPSTSRSRTGCTTSGRCTRSQRASTSSARSRTHAGRGGGRGGVRGGRRGRARSRSRRSCTATTRRREGARSSSTRASSGSSAPSRRPSRSRSRTSRTSARCRSSTAAR